MTEEEESEIEYLPRDEAVSVARAEALRDFVVSADSIRYVAFVSDFDDYCYCEFVEEEGGWIKTIRLLTNKERLPGEEIPDTRIIALAKMGRRIEAIRLYRTKYEVDLAEGVAGVKALLQDT